MKYSLLFRIVSVYVLCIACSSVGASTIASSNFDSGADGWTTLSDDLTWQSTGGYLDTGYIRYNNNLGSNTRIHAPASYLGDWANLGVTDITYRANIFQKGGYVGQQPYRVNISGPGGEATWFGPAADPNTAWKQIDVPIVEPSWTIKSGSWNAILADVTDLNIFLSYYVNTSPFEITGLDNVSLNAVPIIPSFWLFGSGLIGLIGVIRKKRAA